MTVLETMYCSRTQLGLVRREKGKNRNKLTVLIHRGKDNYYYGGFPTCLNSNMVSFGRPAGKWGLPQSPAGELGRPGTTGGTRFYSLFICPISEESLARPRGGGPPFR